MDNIEQVREFFANDRFATENGAVIDEIGDNYAKVSMELTARHRNAMGALMGGATFTLADFAFAVACNHKEVSAVSLSTNITFLSPSRGKKLIAEAHCVKDGRSTCYYKVSVYDDIGTMVADVTINGFKVRKA